MFRLCTNLPSSDPLHSQPAMTYRWRRRMTSQRPDQLERIVLPSPVQGTNEVEGSMPVVLERMPGSRRVPIKPIWNLSRPPPWDLNTKQPCRWLYSSWRYVWWRVWEMWGYLQKRPRRLHTQVCMNAFCCCCYRHLNDFCICIAGYILWCNNLWSVTSWVLLFLFFNI